MYTGTPRNTALKAGNARACGRSIARGRRSTQKVGMIGAGKHVERGTGAGATRGAGAGAGACGRRGTRGSGARCTRGAGAGAVGGRGHVGRWRVTELQ